jgi:DNA-binding response OmpR family regulator
MKARVLLVEDDPGLGYVIQDNLTQKQYDVTLCTDGDDAQKVFFDHSFDICILDVMLPKKDGFSLAQAIRSKNSEVPILFVTAKSMIEDKALGFESGGDDYIVKPFNMEELCMRIEVFLRRSNGKQKNISIPLGTFHFHVDNLMLEHATGTQSLTQKEAQVLQLLCKNNDRILRREEILKSIWGDDDYFMGRSMDVFISRLRKYLKKDPTIKISNHHGVGFRLEVKS